MGMKFGVDDSTLANSTKFGNISFQPVIFLVSLAGDVSVCPSADDVPDR